MSLHLPGLLSRLGLERERVYADVNGPKRGHLQRRLSVYALEDLAREARQRQHLADEETWAQLKKQFARHGVVL